MNTQDIDNEITRLAHLNEIEYISERDVAIEKLKIKKTELNALVKERRRAIEKASKAADKAAFKSQVQFPIGSLLEVAKHFHKHTLKDMVFDDGNFWVYDGRCWVSVYENEVRKLAHGYDGMLCGAGEALKLDSRKLDSIMREASVMAEDRGFFEQAGAGITCKNGVIKFGADGPELHPHSPEQRSRYMVEAEWNPGPVNLEGSLLGRFLDTIFREMDHAEEYKLLIQEAFGAALTGMATKLTQPKCLILVGQSANNGKSSLIKLVRSLPSADAVSGVTPSNFNKEQYRYKLVGKTLNVSDELSPAALESDIFKQLIDGKNLTTAKCVYKPVVDFMPQALHIFAANRKPSFHGGIDSGVRRRVLMIVFGKPIPTEEQINNVEDRIVKEELDLLFAYAIEGAARLHQNQNYTIPPNSHEATEDWVTENDSVKYWFDHRVRLVAPGKTTDTLTPYSLFSHYHAHCVLWKNTKPVGKTEFFNRLGQIEPLLNGIQGKRTNKDRHVIDFVELLNTDIEPGEEYGEQDHDHPEVINVDGGYDSVGNVCSTRKPVV